MTEVQCPSCHSELEVDDLAVSTQFSLATCEVCSTIFGLCAQSHYVVCRCNKYWVGFEPEESEDGYFDDCPSCGVRFTVFSTSNYSAAVACPKGCPSVSLLSREDLDFLADDENSTIQLDCAHSLGREDLKRMTLPNFYSRNLRGIGPSSKPIWTKGDSVTYRPNHIEPVEEESKWDRWGRRAFKAGDPFSMLGNFVLGSIELVQESRKERRDAEVETWEEEIYGEGTRQVVSSAPGASQFESLESRLGHPGRVELSDNNVRQLSELLLLGLAEEIVAETELKRNVRSAARMKPVCSIEDEALSWALAHSRGMTKRQIDAATFLFFKSLPTVILLHGDDALIGFCRSATSYWMAE